MNNVSIRGLKHLWEFCLDATSSDKEASNKFYSLALDLLIKGEVSKNILIKFMEEHDIIAKPSVEKTPKKRSTRAKTVSDDNKRNSQPRYYISCGSSPRSC